MEGCRRAGIIFSLLQLRVPTYFGEVAAGKAAARFSWLWWKNPSEGSSPFPLRQISNEVFQIWWIEQNGLNRLC